MIRLNAISAVAILSCAAASADDRLEIGAVVREFYVQDVTGPAAGNELCYRCRYGNRPVIAIFARRTSDQLAALVKEVDDAVDRNSDKELAAFVVLMTDEPAEQEDALRTWAEQHEFQKVPLTLFDDELGPRAYRLKRDADVTVMMWVGGQLAVNESFDRDGLSPEAVAGVIRNTGKILD